MLQVGENSNNAINEFSKELQHDFLQLLRTSHGTKSVHINHFYQEYIGNKQHVHLNATKWKSLTELAKYLGREGICRVEEIDEKGIHVAWIDNSPEALRRQDAIRKRERLDKGDEEREQRLIREQVERAGQQVAVDAVAPDEAKAFQRTEGEKVKLSFGPKPAILKPVLPASTSEVDGDEPSASPSKPGEMPGTITVPAEQNINATNAQSPAIAISFGTSNKPKNIFAAKRNLLSTRKTSILEVPKKMSEAERIMKEEIERKRFRESNEIAGVNGKRQRIN